MATWQPDGMLPMWYVSIPIEVVCLWYMTAHAPSLVDISVDNIRKTFPCMRASVRFRSASACVKKIKKSALKIDIDDIKAVVSFFFAG